MYDYMQELQRIFFTEPDCSALREEIDALYKKIACQLTKEARRDLLALVDKECSLQDKISLASFTAGFRLAGGLAAELRQEKPFSFDDAEERRSCTMLAQQQNQ